MTFETLEKVLELQNKAYRFLIDLGQRARENPKVLARPVVSQLESAQTCVLWVSENHDGIPVHLRPAVEDVDRFAHLLSAFFKTSFHVHEFAWYGKVYCELRANPRLGPGRRGKRGMRLAGTVDKLEGYALQQLAEDEGIVPDSSQLDQMANDPVMAGDLNLWTYACELVRRSEFASQGPAVHRMWRELDKDERQLLTAQTIWEARGRLLKQMRERMGEK
jgi:hypothetical protein